MSTTVIRPVTVQDARDIAQVVLSDLRTRWRHTVGVARRVEELAYLIEPAERDTLVAAAWLHDIGYAEELFDTGFHPLDGARFLDRYRWPLRVCGLVAHHSGAVYVAADRGLDSSLAAYPAENSSVADLLTYADQTVGPNGHRMPISDRIADMLRRHGPDSPNARVHHIRAPYLLDIADRVEQRLLHVR